MLSAWASGDIDTVCSRCFSAGFAGPPLPGTEGTSAARKWDPINREEFMSFMNSEDGQNCCLFRAMEVVDSAGVTIFFHDLVRFCVLNKNKRSWKKALPHLDKSSLTTLPQKFGATAKKKGFTEEIYEMEDSLIHTCAQKFVPLSELLLYFIDQDILQDTKSFIYLMSHFPHDFPKWRSFLSPTYNFILPDYSQAALELASRSVPPSPTVDTSLSMSFLMLATPPKVIPCTLTSIDLSHNFLTELPETFFKELKALQRLNLSWNTLRSLPDSITSAFELRLVNVEHNDLTSLPQMIGDCMQMELLCGHNRLTSIPHSLVEHIRANKVQYLPNPLNEMPPFKTNVELAVFLEERCLKDSMRWPKVKMVLVGPENVGKTTLLKRFQRKDHDGMSTDGINIQELLIKDVIFNCWDFGGQAVFLPTHQVFSVLNVLSTNYVKFFLTGRALYLVLFDTANPNSHRIEYWLRQIVKTVRTPPYPPIILVGTRADKLPSMERAHELCNSLLAQFKCVVQPGQVVGCIPVCAKDGDLSELLNCIIYTVHAKHSVLKERVPGSWVVLDRVLAEKRKTTQVMHWDEFNTVCKDVKVLPEEILTATRFLHGVGSLLHFETTNSKLGEIVILDPEFLAGVMSTIVTFKTTMINQGCLSKEALLQIWHAYSPDDHPHLIDLLHMFLIMMPFKMPDGREGYLVPCVLPEQEPPEANEIWGDKALDSHYEYERTFIFGSLPIGLFGRILLQILHMKTLIRKAIWRDNARVEAMPPCDSRAQFGYVTFDCTCGFTPYLRVSVRAPKEAKPWLLTQLMDSVQTTLDCFYGVHQLNMQRLITCNHCPPPVSPSIPLPHQFSYDDIAVAISKKTTLLCPVENKEIQLCALVPELIVSTNLTITAEEISDVVPIAEGGYGKIYKGQLDNRVVVLKELKLSSAEQTAEKFSEFHQEATIMSMLDSPYIVRLYGVCMSPLIMVMEYVPLGDLYKLIHTVQGAESDDHKIQRSFSKPELVREHRHRTSVASGTTSHRWQNTELPESSSAGAWSGGSSSGSSAKKDEEYRSTLVNSHSSSNALHGLPEGEQAFETPMSWRMKLLIALDVARGLQYLHSLHPPVVHRDLRSANIFIQTLDTEAPVRAKLADFGLSIKAAGKVAGKLRSWQWLAPEILDTRIETYDEQSDIFSFAILLFEIICRQHPYDEYFSQYSIVTRHSTMEWRDANMKVAISQENLRPTIPRTVPRKVRHLIQRCWRTAPNTRPTAGEVVSKLEEILGITHMSEQDSIAESVPKELPEPTCCWNVPLDAKIWSFSSLEATETHSWVGCADGTARRIDWSSGTFDLKVVAHERKTRIHGLLITNGELWVSSDFGAISIVNLKTMNSPRLLHAHGEKHSISCLIVVNHRKLPSTVWSASSTESAIVEIDPNEKEVTNRVYFDAGLVINSMVQCGKFVWVACTKRILILDSTSMATHRVLSRLPVMGRYSCATVISKRVWLVAQDKICIFDSTHLNCVATLSGHEHDVTALCPCSGAVVSADSEGAIFIWDPHTYMSLRKVTLPNACFINALHTCNERSFMLSTVHPDSAVIQFSF
ncbi:leucinerich repeat kinase [Pelomyxa schiedti]|nr:leucinerich repeat kinase [Pelomyxa schiedti]